MNQRGLVIGALLAMTLSGVMLYKFFTAPKFVDSATQNLFQAYTQITAQDISHLLGGRGDVVVLMWGPPSDDAVHPGGPPDVRAVCEALQKAGLHVVEKSSVPPARVGGRIVWTAESYRSVLEHYPQATALVSFIGTPKLSADNIRELPSPRPKLVVVRFADVETAQPLLEQGVLDGVILPSVGSPSSNHPPKTTQEWFDKYYLFITPATVSELGG
jgi:hypothetical protein